MAQTRVIRSIDGITRTVPKQTRLQRNVRRFKRSRPAQSLLLALVLGSIVAGVLLLPKLFEKPNYDSLTTVTNALSQHMILPQDEKPILATVTDKSLLKTPFLREADNGDKVIIYEKAKKVIIYRPSVDRIVSIGPIELDNIPKNR